MNTTQIRTVKQLRAFMKKVSKEEVKDDNLTWFACIGYAESLTDSSLKDLAWLFRGGVTPVKTLDDVQKYIDTFFEEGESEFNKEQNKYLLDAVYRFYGKQKPE